MMQAGARALASGATLLVGAMLILTGLPGAAQAQSGAVHLPPGHWTWDAVRRLDGLGVAPVGSDPMAAPVTLQHARRVFQASADSARVLGRPQVAALADGYLALLERSEGDATSLRLRAGAGAVGIAGERRAGEHDHDEGFITTRPLGTVRGAVATVGGHGPLGRRAGWRVDAALLDGRVRLPAAVLAVALGPLDGWVGRQRVHYGAGRGGGVVAGSGWASEPLLDERSTLTLNGGGVAVREPFHFPGFFRFLGPIRVEAALGPMESVGGMEGAFLGVGRLTGHPFSHRITLGLNRGALFGGDDRPITAGRLLGLLVGAYGRDDAGERSAWENQVASGVLRVRPPTERFLPMALYLEWGADDMAGAVKDGPGIVAGLELPWLPGLPGASLVLEHTQFSGGHGHWYLNSLYGGSWSDAGRIIGHPLGGIGREWMGRAAWTDPVAGLELSATALTRKRHQWGMFWPDRDGRSRGGAVSAAWRPGPRWTVRGAGFLEAGDGWTDRRAMVRSELAF